MKTKKELEKEISLLKAESGRPLVTVLQPKTRQEIADNCVIRTS